MTVLVTGATGEVGRRFVPRLLQRGTDVRVLVRDEERGARFAALGAQVAVGELRDGGSVVKALGGVDAVVNIAAAFRGVPDEEAWAVNHTAAVALGTAALERGVRRFVQVSTNLTYGAGRGRPASEDDPSAPGGMLWGAYPASKAAADRDLLALHHEHGFDVRIARLAFVYGEGDSHLADSMRWAGHWAAHQRLQLVHHADVCQALWRLLTAPDVAGRAYNVADDAPVTAYELHEANGVEPPAEAAARVDPDPWYGVVTNRRLRDDLGYRPLFPTLWTARDAGAL
ncbi:NAD-dependent epimerase/dehydratase family protein [Yinghuangia seranimata]|uniref:NAD-dependent epimerase/dehydratase family protein n=1 Tax=Yinghuangia seranimata TaxID=408067 RepID=UPI00248A921B|nr:NAD-dependent epimerase/dehydratase family protein [Yinghuangia seranimata]MDI2131485.1 NAD-dependent epimerase/dehydratase family protein [Yinghuangia seranimata]